MSLFFQSICSSSSGNCLTLCSASTRLLIDCGLSSMKRTRQVVNSLGQTLPIDAVLLTHLHGDHISYYPLRVLEDCGLPLHLHADSLSLLREKHGRGGRLGNLRLTPFDGVFDVGDFQIRPFEVVHNPRYATFGFDIRWRDKKVVIATDFCRWENLIEHFADADFIFIESNHDMDLLRQYFNPNSRYHLPNPQTAEMLAAVVNDSKQPPQNVMLGHLSSQRNTPHLAVNETTQTFERLGKPLNFNLSAAPLKDVGDLIAI